MTTDCVLLEENYRRQSPRKYYMSYKEENRSRYVVNKKEEKVVFHAKITSKKNETLISYKYFFLIIYLFCLAWASLDCLLTSLPITPLSYSSAIMRSNGTLPMTDTRRISPQTTSSSGYHSDLSSATSTNDSPQSIHEILPSNLEKSSSSSTSSSHIQKKTVLITTNSTYDRPVPHKNLSRLSSFIRKQYERAKSKFIAKPLSSSSSSSKAPRSTITTCTKATSTTPLSHLSEDNYTLSTKQPQQQQHSLCNQKPHYQQRYLSSVYKQNSFTEPVNLYFFLKKILFFLLRSKGLFCLYTSIK